MTDNFQYFWHRWKETMGDFDQDVSWRAYDIVPYACGPHNPRLVVRALKALHLDYAGELALSHFMALYEFEDAVLARRVLACWWVWRQVTRGRRVWLLPRRVPEGGAGATTLAGGSPEAPVAPGNQP